MADTLHPLSRLTRRGKPAPAAATMTERRPRSDLDSDKVIDMPQTPPASERLSRSRSFSSAPFSTVGAIVGWFTSNIGVLILNKYLLSEYGFRYPVFLTALHMLASTLYCFAAVKWIGLVPAQPIASRRQLVKIAVLSSVFCTSVVCGNVSLRYLPVSFNQAVGATTPFFTAVFAFALTGQRERWTVYLALVPVVLGVVVASNGEPLFNAFGFFFCLAATGGRALKSVLQGILLSSESERLNSINLLLYMAPMAAGALIVVSLLFEGNVAALVLERAAKDRCFGLMLLCNASVACLVNLTNFLVTKYTSALTLQVLGNAKAGLAALVSVLIFRNPVNAKGIGGFLVTIIGVLIYGEMKRRVTGSN